MIDWDDPKWNGLWVSLFSITQVEHWGCWCWLSNGPGLKEGIIHTFEGVDYIVEHTYCLYEGRIYLCINPDHIERGGLDFDGGGH